MRFRPAPAKAEAVDARRAGPAVAHGVIGVARLAGLSAAVRALRPVAARPATDRPASAAVQDELAPFGDETLGRGPDAWAGCSTAFQNSRATRP